jgi:hypothetical protein
MQVEQIVGVISILLLVLSVAMLILNIKEGKYSFAALAVYLFQIILINLFAVKILQPKGPTAYYAGLLNNLLDAPLMLIFLLYFAKIEKAKQWIKMVLVSFIAYELLIWAVLGMNHKTLILIIGPGLFIVTAFSFYFFVTLMRISNFKRKDVGMGFIAGGLVFAYLCFLFIYVIFYIMRSPHIKDIYTIYHISFIIWCLTLIIGMSLIMDKKAKPTISAPNRSKEDPNAFQYL